MRNHMVQPISMMPDKAIRGMVDVVMCGRGKSAKRHEAV
jgi:hypothetical protein